MAAQPGSNNEPSLACPTVAALRQENTSNRAPMQRTDSMNIRDEREDLKQAAEQSLNVILDLSLDGIIRWVSPSWKDVVGSSADKIKGTPIKDLLLSNKDAFSDAVESMKQDDSRSQIVRFHVRRGISATLEAENDRGRGPPQDGSGVQEEQPTEEQDFISLEGQGIMVYDRTSAGESHVCYFLD